MVTWKGIKYAYNEFRTRVIAAAQIIVEIRAHESIPAAQRSVVHASPNQECRFEPIQMNHNGVYARSSKGLGLRWGLMNVMHFKFSKFP